MPESAAPVIPESSEFAVLPESANIKTLCLHRVRQDFTVKLLQEDCSRELILDALHPDGPHCPHCKVFIEDVVTIDNFYSGRRCKCKVCGKWFTATTGTALQNSQFNYSEMIVLCLLSSVGAANKDIAEVLKTTPQTIKTWRMKLETQRA